MTRLALVLVGVLLIAGCGATTTPVEEAAGSQLGRLVQTAIPEGIYFGEVTCHSTSRSGGYVDSDEVWTEARTEVVDGNGLPLAQPEGEAPREGLVLESELSVWGTTITVESITVSGNRLHITFRARLTFEDAVLSGTGSCTYEYSPPDTLAYVATFNFVGANPDTGYSGTVSYEEFGTLSSGRPPTTESESEPEPEPEPEPTFQDGAYVGTSQCQIKTIEQTAFGPVETTEEYSVLLIIEWSPKAIIG